MGGGNSSSFKLELAANGLSPRGRGKQWLPSRRPSGQRSIPAWAGETMTLAETRTYIKVYPRVGGGNLPRNTGLLETFGLSPRGRGKRPAGSRERGIRRSIPAWAGETSCLAPCGGPTPVYPRVGGGNLREFEQVDGEDGLSPRGRGKRGNSHSTTAYHRSIPAWAGETTSPSSRFCPRTVYPRVGGGNATLVQAVPVVWGLSPRGRGKRVSLFSQFTQHGSIPAWAGETHRPAWRRPGGWVYPAWAGETPAPPLPPQRGPVYPRVGGGNIPSVSRGRCPGGLSPRGRGKLIIRGLNRQ